MDDAFDWEELRRTRYSIEYLESKLTELYDKRYEMMTQMRDDGMKQREIGASWGISNPRVSGILNGR